MEKRTKCKTNDPSIQSPRCMQALCVKTDTFRKKRKRFKTRCTIVTGRHLLPTLRAESSGKRAGKAGLGHSREINLRVRETEPVPDEVRLWHENTVLLLFFFFFLLQNNFQLNCQCLEYKRSLLMWNSETDRHQEKPPDQRKELLICSLVETGKFLPGYQTKDALGITLNHQSQ